MSVKVNVTASVRHKSGHVHSSAAVSGKSLERDAGRLALCIFINAITTASNRPIL